MSVIAAYAQWTTNNYGSQMGHDSRAVECSVAGEDRTANRLSALRRLGRRRAVHETGFGAIRGLVSDAHIKHSTSAISRTNA